MTRGGAFFSLVSQSQPLALACVDILFLYLSYLYFNTYYVFFVVLLARYLAPSLLFIESKLGLLLYSHYVFITDVLLSPFDLLNVAIHWTLIKSKYLILSSHRCTYILLLYLYFLSDYPLVDSQLVIFYCHLFLLCEAPLSHYQGL